jgi:hypothetical protein
VDEAKDVAENLGVVRILLEANQLRIDNVEAFARLREKFAQQLVHEFGFRRSAQRNGRRPSSSAGPAVTFIASVLVNGLILVAPNDDRRAHLRLVMADFRTAGYGHSPAVSARAQTIKTKSTRKRGSCTGENQTAPASRRSRATHHNNA